MFDFHYAYDFLKYKNIQLKNCQARFIFHDFKKVISLLEDGKFSFSDKSYNKALRKLNSKDGRVLAQLGYRHETDVQKAKNDLIQMGEEGYNSMNKPFQKACSSVFLLGYGPSSNFFQFYSKI